MPLGPLVPKRHTDRIIPFCCFERLVKRFCLIPVKKIYAHDAFVNRTLLAGSRIHAGFRAWTFETFPKHEVATRFEYRAVGFSSRLVAQSKRDFLAV